MRSYSEYGTYDKVSGNWSEGLIKALLNGVSTLDSEKNRSEKFLRRILCKSSLTLSALPHLFQGETF